MNIKFRDGHFQQTRKQITFTDKKGIGKLKLKGTWNLNFYQIEQIKRVRLVRRADGYYVQFLIKTDVKVEVKPTGKTIGLEVGLKEFYTDSNGHTEPNPRFYRTGENRLKFYQRRVSRKKKGSSNRKKAINKLGRTHLNISRKREERAKRIARCVIKSNDLANTAEAPRLYPKGERGMNASELTIVPCPRLRPWTGNIEETNKSGAKLFYSKSISL